MISEQKDYWTNDYLTQGIREPLKLMIRKITEEEE
jgi:hypothetical protein